MNTGIKVTVLRAQSAMGTARGVPVTCKWSGDRENNCCTPMFSGKIDKRRCGKQTAEKHHRQTYGLSHQNRRIHVHQEITLAAEHFEAVDDRNKTPTRAHEYIGNHRRLKDDMLEAGMPEAQYKHLTIKAIINGTEENVAWASFRTSLATSKDEAYPQTIKELKNMMSVYVTALLGNKYDKPYRTIPNP